MVMPTAHPPDMEKESTRRNLPSPATPLGRWVLLIVNRLGGITFLFAKNVYLHCSFWGFFQLVIMLSQKLHLFQLTILVFIICKSISVKHFKTIICFVFGKKRDENKTMWQNLLLLYFCCRIQKNVIVIGQTVSINDISRMCVLSWLSFHLKFAGYKQKNVFLKIKMW